VIRGIVMRHRSVVEQITVLARMIAARCVNGAYGQI
jgi:hypothetical protein